MIYSDLPRSAYASALCEDADATLDDFRKAVATLEETERTTRGTYFLYSNIGERTTREGVVDELRDVRAVRRHLRRERSSLIALAASRTCSGHDRTRVVWLVMRLV